MTEFEFKENIDIAEKQLRIPICSSVYPGVCDVLYSIFSSEDIEKYFKSLFYPPIEHPNFGHNWYWFGRRDRKNIEIRELALRVFERICLDKHKYVGW